MKVAVIGGLGFIGSFVVESLVDKGYDVVVVSKSKKGLWRLRDLYDEGAFELRYGDVLKFFSLKRRLSDVDVVINMVALISHRVKGITYQVNFHGAFNVFKAAYELGIKKVVHTSVAQVYLPQKVEVVKSIKYHAPLSEYLAGKIGGELVAKKFVKKGLESVILRPTVVIGPKSPHGLNTLILLSMTGLHPVSMGNGGVLMNPVYVEDLAEAFTVSVESGEGVFYVSGPKVSTLKDILGYSARKGLGIPTIAFINYPEMATAVLKATNRLASLINIKLPLPTERGVIDTLFKHNIYDYRRFSEETGWRPRFSVFQSIDETAKWYKINNLLNPLRALKFLITGRV